MLKKNNKNTTHNQNWDWTTLPISKLHWQMLTWKAKSWYCCFSLGPRAYHHSPRILLTVRLSWLGWRWCTRARWRLLKIMNAFMGRRMWSFSRWGEVPNEGSLHILQQVSQGVHSFLFLFFHWVNWPSCLHPLVRHSGTECASSSGQRRVPDRWPRPERSWQRQNSRGEISRGHTSEETTCKGCKRNE